MKKLANINKEKIKFYLKKFFCEKIVFKWENLTEKFLLKKLNNNTKKKKIIDFCIYFWGDEFTSMLTECMIPSLVQENNIPKLLKENYTINLNFYIKREWNSDKFDSYLRKSELSNSFNIKIYKIPSHGINDKYFLMLCHYKAAIQSYKNGSIFCLLAPDLFFGDKSIYNMIKLVDKYDFGYTANPPRVLKNETLSFILKNIPTKSLKNMDLLKFAVANLHPSNLIDDSHDNNSIKTIDQNTMISSYNRKSCNFIRLNKSDLKLFSIYHDFNLLDKHWPRKLFLEGRLKAITDPSFYFHVELTDKEDKRSSIIQSNNYDSVKLNLINLVNNNSSSIWKI